MILNKILVISGPTASGKSYLAEQLIENKSSAIIINADSMQVYKDLPILSNQPNIQENSIYKLYGFLNFDAHYSAGIWCNDVQRIVKEAFEEEKLPIIVGGTGLYIKALLEGIVKIPDIETSIRQNVRKKFLKLGKEKFYEDLKSVDSETAKKIHSNDSYRMQRAMEVYMQTGKSVSDFKNSDPYYKFVHISILPNRDTLYNNCNLRLKTMIANGAIDEVRLLVEKISKRLGKYNVENTLGYKEIVSYLNKEITLDEALVQAGQVTRNYAKRQYTWFRNQFIDKIALYYDSDVKEVREDFFQIVRRFYG